MEGYIGCCFFFPSGYIYLGNGATDWHEILHVSPGQVFSHFGGDAPGEPYWPCDCEYLASVKLRHYMS